MPSSKLGDHRLAAAGVAAHRVDRDRIVGRHQARVDQRPEQRDRAGRIAAGVRDLPRRPDLVGLIRRRAPGNRRSSRARRDAPSTHPAPSAPALPMPSISATVSRAAASGRQRMTRSTSSISARLAAASLRFSGAMLFTATSPCWSRRVRMPSPVVPDSPSTKTAGFVTAVGGRLALRPLGVDEGHGVLLQPASLLRGVDDR